MHIFRWLMKHPILLAWLLAVLAILLNFSMGGKASHEEVAGGHGKETAHQEAPAAAGSHEQAAAPVAAQQGMAGHEQASAAAPQVQAPATQAAVADHAQDKDGAAPAQQGMAGGHEQAAAAQSAAPAQQGMAATTAPAQPVAGIADAANTVNQQGMAATDAAVPAPAAGDAAAVAETPANLLRAAREAYWSNDLGNAVEFYTKLIQQDPSLDNKGELANVYWMQGNAKQAAALFAEIAPQRAAQGRMSQALNMKLYVDMVDPELAKQVDAALKK